MPAYNFKERFAAMVANREKTQTIRKKRKRPTREGDQLFLYTGMRTKHCRKLREAKCIQVFRVAIYNGGICLAGRNMMPGTLSADRFARNDGFEDSEEMIQWFKHAYGLPFIGEVIYW